MRSQRQVLFFESCACEQSIDGSQGRSAQQNYHHVELKANFSSDCLTGLWGRPSWAQRHTRLTNRWCDLRTATALDHLNFRLKIWDQQWLLEAISLLLSRTEASLWQQCWPPPKRLQSFSQIAIPPLRIPRAAFCKRSSECWFPLQNFVTLHQPLCSDFCSASGRKISNSRACLCIQLQQGTHLKERSAHRKA